jgi:antirestriction protein
MGEDHIQEEVAKILRTSKYPNVTVECPACEGSGQMETGIGMFPCDTCHGECKVPSAEEWAIHDYEGFAGIKLSESESFDNVAALAELIEEHGEELIEAASDYESTSDVDELRSIIEDRYRGTYDSREAFAQEMIEECYDLKDTPDIIKHHIDWDGIAHDLECGGDYSFIRKGGEVYVFDNNA